MSSAIKIRLLNPQNAVTGFIAFNLLTYILFQIGDDLAGIARIEIIGWISLTLLLFAGKQSVNLYYIYLSRGFSTKVALVIFILSEIGAAFYFGMFSLFSPALWIFLFEYRFSLF